MQLALSNKDEVNVKPVTPSFNFRLQTNETAAYNNSVPYFVSISSVANRSPSSKLEFAAFDPARLTWKEHVWHFEYHAAAMRFTESDCCFYLWQSLRGDLAVLVAGVDYYLRSYVSLRNELTAKVETCTTRDSRQWQFDSISRGKTESLEVYFYRVSTLASRAFQEMLHSPAALHQHVIEKFAATASRYPNFRFDFLLMNPATADDAIKVANNIERVSRMRGVQVAAVQGQNGWPANTSSGNDGWSASGERGSHHGGGTGAYHGGDRGSYRSGDSGAVHGGDRWSSQRGGDRQNRGGASGRPAKRDPSSITCFWCGEKGHMRAQCELLQRLKMFLSQPSQPAVSDGHLN